MASWRIRFHDKWPHLSTLYTSTHNLDEAGKNPDPLMGIDNVFDPNEPYGAYRYYVQPRSEMSIEEPCYTRGVYKDDESRSRSSDYVIGGGFKRGSACRIILCIFLVMSFIGVVLAAITLAVILSQHNVTRRWPSPMEFDSEMTLNGANFTYKLRDNTSEEFKAMEKSFCSALHELFLADDSPIKYEWSGCEVLEFLNGSVVTRFRIFVRPREKVDTEGTRSMEEELITYLTKKLNDDGPWKPLKINLDSIKNFVKVDKTGGMTIIPSITTPTSGTNKTTTSTTTSIIAKAVIRTKEIVNTSPKMLITSEGIVNTHPTTRSTLTEASTQDLVLTERVPDVPMKYVTTVGVKTEALGVSSTSTASTVTGDYVGKFSTVTTERQTVQASQVVSTAGRAKAAVFTKGVSEVISTGIVLNMTDTTTKRTTTFTTEGTSTELDITLSTTPSPIQSIVSIDTNRIVSTLTTPIHRADRTEQSTIKILSEGTRKLVTARNEDTTTSFDTPVTTQGGMAFDSISTQHENITSNRLSTTSSSSENATEISATLDLINASTPMALVSNAEHLEVNTTAFTDVVSTLSADLRLVSTMENMTTSSSEKSLHEEDRTLLLKTSLSSTVNPIDFIVLNKGSTLDTSAHSAVFLTTLSPEVSSITDLEPNISTITEIATTFKSNDTTDSTIVPVDTSTDIVPSELPSVIDGTTVSPDVAVSTYTNVNVSEEISFETSADVNATHPEIEFTTLASKFSTEATNTSTNVPSAHVEVSTNTTLVDAFVNVSDLILANVSLDLSTTIGRTTGFVGTTISSDITATTDIDITALSVDNSTIKMQAASSKMIISSESVQVSSVAEVVVTESIQQQENVSLQPNNVTLGMDQKPSTAPRNETSDKPEFNVTLAVLSSTDLVLEDATTAEPAENSTHSLDITSTPSAATDVVKMEVATSLITITMEHLPTTSKIPSITTSEVTRKTVVTEVDRPTITSTAEYNYTSIDGNFSNVSSGPIHSETTDSPLTGNKIVSNISAESTDQNVAVAQLQSTTEAITTSLDSHSARQTTYIITLGTNNSTIGSSQTDSSRTSTDLDGVSSVDARLNSVSSGPIYNETTDSPLAVNEIISNISAVSTDQNVAEVQLQSTTEAIATSLDSHSARQTTYITTIGTNNSTIGSSQTDSSRTSTDQGLVDGILSVDAHLNSVSSGRINNETTDLPWTVKEIVSNISAESTDQNVTVAQVQSTTEMMTTPSISHSERQITEILATGTNNSMIGTSQSNSSLTSTDQHLADGISSADENFNVSSGPVYNETTESVLNIFAETTDQNLTVAQVQTMTESMAATTVSNSARQTTQVTTTETMNFAFGTSKTSTDQGLVNGISSEDANLNVSSGTINNETTHSPLTEKEIVSNISAEFTDQNVTVAQVLTTAESIADSTVSHSERQTTTILITETINSLLVTSQSNISRTSTDQGLVDGISSVDEKFNVSSGPMNNETTDSSLAVKEIILNISAEIADQNSIVPQLQTTTERIVTPSVSHSERQTTEILATGTNNSTIGTSQRNSSLISTDQDLAGGISSASVIEETSLSGLTEIGSQQPAAAASVNATAITTVEMINFTTKPQPLVSEHVSDGHPFSNALNTSIDIFNNANVTLSISNDTTPLNKWTTDGTVTDVTTENPNNTDTTNVTILSVVSDSVNIAVLASESITTNDFREMTTVLTNSIAWDNQTETVLAVVTTNSVNVTENINDTYLTGNLANTTENSLYNETVNGNITETNPYILNSTNNYQNETEFGTLNVELRGDGTSPHPGIHPII